MTRRRIGSLLGLTLLVLGAGVPRAAGAVDQAMVAAAKQEGRLTLYTAMAQDVAQAVVNAFNKDYPTIKVSILRLASNQLATRFTTEASSGVFTADLFDAGTPQVQEQKPELFVPISALKLDHLAEIDPRGIRANYVSYFLSTAVLAYNTNRISAADAPRTWADLLKPSLSRRVAMNDPRASDVWMAWANAMYQTYGADYLSKLAAQKPQMFDSGVPAAQQVAAGRFYVAVPITQSHTKQLLDSGAPIAVVGLQPGELDPAFGFDRLVSVVAKAPNPNAARLFLDWFLSAPAQEIACEHAYISYNVRAQGCQKVPANLIRADFDISAERRAEILKLLNLR